MLADITPVGTTTCSTGLWRLTASAPPGPVAVNGQGDAYLPGPGRSWSNFIKFAVFDSGDIVALARATNPGETGIWPFRIGAPPQRVLGVGDLVDVQTDTGVGQAAVIAVSNSSHLVAGDGGAGDDGWANASGVLLHAATLEGFGSDDVRGRVAAADLLFADGFDQAAPGPRRLVSPWRQPRPGAGAA